MHCSLTDLAVILGHYFSVQLPLKVIGRQYTPLLEAYKPALSIPCYNTQINAIKQLLYYYQETS